MNYEVEVAAGLAPIATEELKQILGTHGKINGLHRKSEIAFEYHQTPHDLIGLQTVIAVYMVLHFEVPRPKALLGHQNITRLLHHIKTAMEIHGLEQYKTLYISAAGSNSSVMNRIKEGIAKETNLAIGADEGDLFIRIRPTPGQKKGWDVLIRLSPRPLATRDWRVCNMEGALNASVAHAMIEISEPHPQDIFLNIGCGSGTIMIERATHMAFKQIIGCDLEETALDCARENIKASHLEDQIKILHADGCTLPFADASIDVICADLPFGQLVGSHEDNIRLYPALLQEMYRVAKSTTRCILITHEIRLVEQSIRKMGHWEIMKTIPITLSGLHPKIYVLKRR